MNNELSLESLQLLDELNGQFYSGYRGMLDETFQIDDEWLNEFVEEYNM